MIKDNTDRRFRKNSDDGAKYKELALKNTKNSVSYAMNIDTLVRSEKHIISALLSDFSMLTDI